MGSNQVKEDIIKRYCSTGEVIIVVADYTATAAAVAARLVKDLIIMEPNFDEMIISLWLQLVPLKCTE